MPYPPELVEPMRRELTAIGVKELRTPQEVDEVMRPSAGTVLLFVNSVCGCAAGTARPGLSAALQNAVLPDVVATVFAGVDVEATTRARSYFADSPPSSPQVALFRDGKLVQLIQRHQIEGRTAEAVAAALTRVFDQYCRQTV